MRIAVFGSGGIGGYFGGKLAKAGEDVVFIARGEHLKAMLQRGLKVDSIKGDFIIDPVQASDNPSAVGQVDVILVCVKAWQVEEAAKAMQPMVGADTYVVPLLNGVEAPEQLVDALGRQHVLGGLCHIMSYITEPGHIVHAGIEPHIALGELDGQPSQRAERLRSVFEDAEVWAEIPEDIQAAMWEKFLFIASISGIGAVMRVPIGTIRHLPETRQMLRQAMEEVASLAAAYEVNSPADIVEKTMNFIDNLPEGTTASMQRDIMAGRPSELGSQNGAIVRFASKCGLDTPVHKFIYTSLLPQEMLARGLET
ncbi:MAG: 2-dehydropantoate 2-reductase [Anaerolineales bacterium]|nr:2-dehydropantoate 2-reductase [Anaerolineales bacterium]